MKDSLPQAAYDELAESYAEIIDKKPHNAFYDRPAVKSLVKDLKGKKILEPGCGTGAYTEWLVNNGANVVGIDANENMLHYAIAKVKGRAEIIKANLEEPLSFLQNATFDGIISALTITYLNNLNIVFSEFSRVLKSNGWFVFSTEHPFFSYTYNNLENYYETKEVHTKWTGFRKTVVMKSYYHSLSTITEALTNNGFYIDKLIEPFPTEEFQAADPNNYDKLRKFPLFIFLISAMIQPTH